MERHVDRSGESGDGTPSEMRAGRLALLTFAAFYEADKVWIAVEFISHPNTITPFPTRACMPSMFDHVRFK